MTKRFTLTNPKNSFQDMKCGINDRNKTLTFNEVIDLLNKLAEENQHFEYDNKRMVKFIMSKGYGFKDYLDFCKEYEE